MTGTVPFDSSDSGYEVYPESLRNATEDIYHAAGRLRDLADRDLGGLGLSSQDVGMLGDRGVRAHAKNE